MNSHPLHFFYWLSLYIQVRYLMQMRYNIQKVRKDSAFMDKLANVRRIAAVL